MITHEFLLSILRYEPDTGLFYWRVKRGNAGAFLGDVAGSLHPRGHIFIRVGKLYAAHRLAHFYMTKTWPPEQIDHKNGIKNDNRWINLRCVTNQENAQNQVHLRVINTSGHRGVSKHKGANKWAAYIRGGGKIIHLGYFHLLEDAVAARLAAELIYYPTRPRSTAHEASRRASR